MYLTAIFNNRTYAIMPIETSSQETAITNHNAAFPRAEFQIVDVLPDSARHYRDFIGAYRRR